MNSYINLESAYDNATLSDWLIHSVGPEPPIWTQDHIDELLENFYVIPKSILARELAFTQLDGFIQTKDIATAILNFIKSEDFNKVVSSMDGCTPGLLMATLGLAGCVILASTPKYDRLFKVELRDIDGL